MINDKESHKIRHVRGMDPASDTWEAAAQSAAAPPPMDLDAAGSRTRTPYGKQANRKYAVKRGILFALLGLFLALLGVGMKFYLDVSNPDTVFGTASGQDAEQQLLSQADLAFMKDRVNILVLGLDKSAERQGWGSFRTDTMILATIDFTNNEVDLISIPRDSYVKIVDAEGEVHGRGKINSAFSAGGGLEEKGYEYAMGTASYLLGGIPINYYLGFDMNVVMDVVNAMGGIDYDVDTEVDLDGTVLHLGMQHLDGKQVLEYARQRKGSSDIARVERQQKVIMAIFQQLKSTGQIPRIPEIYQAVEQNIQTNLSFKQISALALLALKMDVSQLQRHMVSGNFLDMDSGSYWGVNTKELEKLIQDIFGTEVSIDDEIGIENAKAPIEEDSDRMAEELLNAEEAVSRGQDLMEGYGSHLEINSRNRLQQYIDLVQDAMEAQDKEQLVSETNRLEKYCDAVEESLRNAGLLP